MKADAFIELERRFHEALELDEDGRQAIIDELKGQDPELGARLEAMLAADDQGVDPMTRLIARSGEAALPESIGPFRVLKRLGEGGMGVVYLCRRDDEDFEQLLAVKRLNAAADSPTARERLRIERRLLAGLRHPHIAQLVDGGEEADGTPFVAMEYVDGVPILHYAEREALDAAGRVRLFLGLCQAVQFAHQNFVVHRDIKPANVMIDRAGHLKLLDFGIAKLLEERTGGDRTVLTVAGAMTPHYASPEQVRGEAVTPLSDVYSLGVVLYELLSGRRPYEIGTRRPTEIERIVCRHEPPSPLPGGRGRNGDLNCIVARAMHKAPERRYASAAQLAEDLERWLDGRPVQARPDSAGYRLRTFARRHPFGVAASTLLTVLLIAFSAAMTWQAGQLALQRDRAEQEARIANETADFLVELFATSDPRETNPAEVTARDLLERAAGRLPAELESDPLMRARLMHVIGLAFANLGDDIRGTELLAGALALREAHAGPDSPETADSLNRLGNVHRRFGRLVQAEPMLVRALEWRRDHGAVDHDLADSYNNVGLLRNELGWYEQAEAALREAIDLHRRVGGPATTQAAAPLHNLALSLRSQGRLDAARQAALDSLALKRPNDWSLSSLANTLAVLAGIERRRGDLPAALAASTESLQLREQVFGRDNVMIASGLATHAGILHALSRKESAESLYREALALHERAGSADSLRAADIQLGYARFLQQVGRTGEAAAFMARARAVAQRELPPDSPELARFLEPQGGAGR
jgi:serine/threonine-protein kinase